jgi:hypothetical protein
LRFHVTIDAAFAPSVASEMWRLEYFIMEIFTIDLTILAVEEKTHASLAQASPQDAPAFQMNARPAHSISRVSGCSLWIFPQDATWLSNKGSMYLCVFFVYVVAFMAYKLLFCINSC